MKCKLPNLLLSLRKSSQDISETTCKWIPLPPLNKEWTDKEIYSFFKLSEDEIKLIKETTISGYKDLIINKNSDDSGIVKDKKKKLSKPKIIITNENIILEDKPEIKAKKVIKKKVKKDNNIEV